MNVSGRALGIMSAGVLLAGLVPAYGQQQTLHIDPSRSTVAFDLADPVHGVHGTFHVQDGDVTFDSANGTMGGNVLVDARSGNSGNSSRDKKMTNDELKANQYTTVSFVPKHFSGALSPAGDSSITVSGTFTLLGSPHEISVPMKVHISGTDCQASGKFDVPYVQWGMKDPSNFLLHVGKTVSVDLTLDGTLSPAK